MPSKPRPPVLSLLWVLGAALLCSAVASQLWERVLPKGPVAFLLLFLAGALVVGLLALRLGVRDTHASRRSRRGASRSARPADRRRGSPTQRHDRHEGARPKRPPSDGSARPVEEVKKGLSKERMTGTLKFFHPESQYGFIQREDQPDLYFSGDGISEGTSADELTRGRAVSFRTGHGRKGPAGYDVRPHDASAQD